jgi:hypothetical protein
MSSPRSGPTPRRASAPRIAAALLALSFGAAACTSSDGESSTPATDLGGDEIQLTSALYTVDSCDALLERLRAEGSERVGPYGFDQGFHAIAVDEMAVEAATADEAGAADGATSAPAAGEADTSFRAGGDGGGDGSFSGTNNQEAGVDEADLVKTDGRRLVVASGNRLEVIDVEEPEPRLVNTVKLPDELWGGELFLRGDTALLMTSGWTEVPFTREAASDWFPGSPTGRIMEIDLAAGTIERTLEFEGGYLSAREVDGTIRIVLSAAHSRFNFLYPSNPGAEDAAEKANRALVEESTIDMWIPTFRLSEGDEIVSEGPVVDCDRVHLPSEFAGFGSMVVLTVDIDDGLEVQDSVSVFTDAQTVYASPDRLAVATPRWPELDDRGLPKEDDDYRTAIHHFDISDAGRTEYTASGSVRGHLLSQYSLSEAGGFLRVATTDGSPWGGDSSESFVTVLTESGDELVQVGQVGGLGKGEQIFAVRFLGDLAYVVTFRQIDPLYTVDLSDPENPTVRGELKIPGFSSYLHPWGDDLLVGIGTDGDEDGRTSGAVASLFDVSDPDQPTLIDKLPLGPSAVAGGERFESYSPISGDPKAFTPWGDTFIAPVSWWGYTEGPGPYQETNGSAAVLVAVDAESGTLTPIGRVGHPATEECEGKPMPVESGGVEVQTGGFEGAGAPTATTTVPEVETPETTTSTSSGDAEAEFARPEEPPADEEAPATESLIRPDEHCWRYQPEIRRSVIIDGNLFTVSDAGVAVNELDGLATVTWIPFERR